MDKYQSAIDEEIKEVLEANEIHVVGQADNAEEALSLMLR